MKFNYSKLKGKIIEKYGKQVDFATAMGFTPTHLSRKLNNKIAFNVDDMIRACNLLHIELKDIAEYFFTPKV